MRPHPSIRTHISHAAAAMRSGEQVYRAEAEAGQSAKGLHRALWRLARKFGYKWRMKREGVRVEISERIVV